MIVISVVKACNISRDSRVAYLETAVLFDKHNLRTVGIFRLTQDVRKRILLIAYVNNNCAFVKYLYNFEKYEKHYSEKAFN